MKPNLPADTESRIAIVKLGVPIRIVLRVDDELAFHQCNQFVLRPLPVQVRPRSSGRLELWVDSPLAGSANEPPFFRRKPLV